MKFLTYKDMIKLNHVLWDGRHWESRYNATRKTVKEQCYEDSKDFFIAFRTDGMIRPRPLCKRDQKLEKWCIFISLDLDHLAVVGDFELEIQVITDPSWHKASQSSLVSTMNPCKSHKFTFPLFAILNPICAYCAFSPCSWRSGQWASPLNSSLLVRSCLHF